MPSPSPSFQPSISRILVNTTSSIRVNTGAISYVNLTHSHAPCSGLLESAVHDSVCLEMYVNDVKFLYLISHVKIREGWAKVWVSLVKYNLGRNLWYTYVGTVELGDYRLTVLKKHISTLPRLYVERPNKRTATCSHVGVRSSSEPFSSQADNVESGRQLVKEARMTFTRHINTHMV